MAYTLGEASKATGISKTSIHRAINAGRISAHRNENGSYSIDAAELHRVYPPASNGNSSPEQDMERSVTPENVSGTGALRREVELLRERLTDKDTVIEDLRRRLDTEAEERRKLTAILTDQRPKPEPQPDQSPAATPAPVRQQAGLLGRLRYLVSGRT